MQVTNSSNFASSSVHTLNNRTSIKNQSAKTSAQDEKQLTSTKPTNRLDINDQAIALLDQQSTNISEQKNLQRTAQKNKSANLDQPSEQNLSAVNAYQSVNNLTQRENIQAMLGVDLFA